MTTRFWPYDDEHGDDDNAFHGCVVIIITTTGDDDAGVDLPPGRGGGADDDDDRRRGGEDELTLGGCGLGWEQKTAETETRGWNRGPRGLGDGLEPTARGLIGWRWS
jgi:hypothetical protein